MDKTCPNLGLRDEARDNVVLGPRDRHRGPNCEDF